MDYKKKSKTPEKNSGKRPEFIQFKIMKALFAAAVVFLILLLQTEGGIFSPFPYRSLAPFSGKVIDSDSEEPLSDAAVVAVYYATWYTPFGANSREIDCQETLTDKNGEFKIPRTRRWFALHRGYPYAEIMIFKPGYGFFPYDKKSEAQCASKTCPPPGKYIEYRLPKLISIKEKDDNLDHFIEPDLPFSKLKQLFRLINQERVSLGYTPYPMGEEER